VFFTLSYTLLAIHCLGNRLDEKLTPAPADAAMAGNPIFDIPIVLIPGK